MSDLLNDKVSTKQEGGDEKEDQEFQEGRASDFDVLDIVRARSTDGGALLQKNKEKLEAYHHKKRPAKAVHADEALQTPNSAVQHKRANIDGHPRPGEKGNDQLSANQNKEKDAESGEFDVMKIVEQRAREANRGEAHTCNTAPQTDAEPEQQFTKPGVPAMGSNGFIPGAYTAAPGASCKHLDHVRFSLLGLPVKASQQIIGTDQPQVERIDEGTNEEPSSDMNWTASNKNSTNNEESTNKSPPEPTLVEADPVRESMITEAKPFDMDAVERKAKRKRRNRAICVIALALTCAAAFGLVLKFVFWRRNSTTRPAPSLSPSEPPSIAPSAAPSGPLDELITTLPDYTQASLRNPNSVQSLAYNWLSNHQNITHLEEWRKTQLFALATFYYAFDGPNWPHGLNEDWLDDRKPECDWFSSTVFSWGMDGQFNGYQNTDSCNSHGEFQALVLQNSLNLTGYEPTMPPEIGLLTALSKIDLSFNFFYSSTTDMLIPLQSYVANLTDLALYYNYLSGTIPTEVGLMSTLLDLRLDYTLLNGALPSEMGLMRDLQRLRLDHCSLSGNLPSELGLMPKTTSLLLSNNYLSGALPSELWSMPELGYILLNENSLSGQIPTEIGLATRLKRLDLSRNSLSGTLPSEMGLMTELVEVSVSNNLLSGPIPTEVALLSQLKALVANGNSLSGRIPSQMAALTSLGWLIINSNSLSGPIPSELAAMTALQYLQLAGNSFSGKLPTDLGRPLGDLSILSISNNPLLSGTIPSGVCYLGSPACVFTELAKMTFEPETGASIPWYYNASCELAYNCTDLLCGCNCTCSSS